jgi:phage shock protein C
MRERLYRSREDRMLFGVAGGMARFFDIDPSIVRIVWALLVLAGGAGILLYIVAAIVIPEAPVGWEPSTGSGAPNDLAPSTPTDDAAGSPADAAPGAGTGTPGPAWGYRAGVERRGSGGGAVLLGIVLVALGAWFLLGRFLPAIDAALLWPVVLLVVGAALIVGALRR